MTDRELLELAARAAGYAIHDFYIDVEAWAYQEGSEPDHDGELPIFLWKPLTDDGDALRLAVKLGIAVSQHPHGSNACAGEIDCTELFQDRGLPIETICESTRRAIVRAAAEIGAKS